MKGIVLLALAIAVNCAARITQSIVFFDKMQAASILLFVLAGMFNDKSKMSNIAFGGTAILCVYNLFDELFGDPIHMTVTELVCGISVVVLTITLMNYER